MERDFKDFTDLDPTGDIRFIIRRPEYGKEHIPVRSNALDLEPTLLLPQTPGDPKIEYSVRASSRQLKLHSAYFMRMLHPDSLLGSILDSTGFLSLDVRHWCPRAFYIVLCLIHGKTQAMSRSIDLPTLARVTAVVEFYGCFKAAVFFCHVWLDVFWRARQSRLGPREAVVLIWLAWFWDNPSVFKSSTTHGIRCSNRMFTEANVGLLPQPIIC